MKTQVLATATPEQLETAVALAVEHLQRGETVALPTETVYGLAADALNVEAALKIFEAKERPKFDPLIMHLPDRDWLDQVASVSSAEARMVEKLVDAFWPGPLTLVLPRLPIVPDAVTAGLPTVAVRMSAHAVFARVVQAFGHPLAAPSANRFGRISPTTAHHVLTELDGRVGLIVDAGPTMHGLESTIVAVRGGAIEILRPGPISFEQLATFGNVRATAMGERPEAPGQLRSHYAPRTPFLLVPRLDAFTRPTGKRIGMLSLTGETIGNFTVSRSLSPTGDMREAAANLFRCLRELDDAGLDLIVAEQMPDSGLGVAINDRLRRAAARP